jgi:hypothetical protein
METMIANPPEKPVPEKKENRTWPIVGAVAAIVLCGLTGLCLLCPLSLAVFTNSVPNPSSSGGTLPQAVGLVPLCLSIIFIAIGVVVPVLTLRKKKPAAPVSTPPDEPLPPAS